LLINFELVVMEVAGRFLLKTEYDSTGNPALFLEGRGRLVF
jgi:hypothetical protein